MNYPGGWQDLSEAERKQMSNGCGPGPWLSRIIPNHLLWLDIEEA